ncbi:MAG: hypothetical protein QM760_20220 [Nibricoccus sp.]
MIQPYEKILNEFAAELGNMGFARENESSHGACFRRTDGLSFLVSLERPANGFSVELQPTGVKIGDGYSAGLLMEALAPDRFRRIKESLANQSDPEFLRLWWREFCGFLRDEGGKLNPLPASLKAQYDAICAAKMRAFGLE